MTIGDQSCDQVHHKACHTPVPAMLNLADVLQRIVHGLDQRALPQEQLVPEAYQTLLHVLADFCQALKPSGEQDVMQGLRDITSVPQELSTQACGKPLDGLTVIDIAWRHAKGASFALVIDKEMELEAEKPSHRGLAPHGYACKDFVPTFKDSD